MDLQAVGTAEQRQLSQDFIALAGTSALEQIGRACIRWGKAFG